MKTYGAVSRPFYEVVGLGDALYLVLEVVEAMEWVAKVAIEDVIPTDWNVWDDV